MLLPIFPDSHLRAGAQRRQPCRTATADHHAPEHAVRHHRDVARGMRAAHRATAALARSCRDSSLCRVGGSGSRRGSMHSIPQASAIRARRSLGVVVPASVAAMPFLQLVGERDGQRHVAIDDRRCLPRAIQRRYEHCVYAEARQQAPAGAGSLRVDCVDVGVELALHAQARAPFVAAMA